MTTFFRQLRQLASLSDEALGEAWEWRSNEEPVERRYVLFFMLEGELHRAAVAQASLRREAQRAMSLAQAEFGDLRGLLAAVPEELLDRTPDAETWSIRETLRHALETELTYRAAIEWSLGRGATDPLRLPPERRPSLAILEGNSDDIVERFERERAATDDLVGNLDDARLALPSDWSGHPVDVRFRLYRLAAHLAEHAIQCERIAERLGLRLGDAARHVRRISRARGLHERFSPGGAVPGG